MALFVPLLLLCGVLPAAPAGLLGQATALLAASLLLLALLTLVALLSVLLAALLSVLTLLALVTLLAVLALLSALLALLALVARELAGLGVTLLGLGGVLAADAPALLLALLTAELLLSAHLSLVAHLAPLAVPLSALLPLLTLVARELAGLGIALLGLGGVLAADAAALLTAELLALLAHLPLLASLLTHLPLLAHPLVAALPAGEPAGLGVALLGLCGVAAAATPTLLSAEPLLASLLLLTSLSHLAVLSLLADESALGVTLLGLGGVPTAT